MSKTNNDIELVSRQAAIDTIKSWLSCDDYNETERHIMRAMQSVLYDLPPVTPQPKTGRWIAVENEEMEVVGYYCSECDLPMETKQRTNFCPNCGAKMQEVGKT